MASGAEKVKKLLQAARKQIQKGERRKALETYRKALELDPENHQIMDRISIVEREIAAMEKFNKSRSSRAHSAGRNISSSSFVDDCIKRSDEAIEAGDLVRALQELERAKRHDPDNTKVKEKIVKVRRVIKVDGIADMVRSRLESNDPAIAVENIRRIFQLWPSAPVLKELLDLAEAYKEPPVGEKKEKAAAVVTPSGKKETAVEKEAPPAKTVSKKPEKKAKPVLTGSRKKEREKGQKKIFIVIAGIVFLIVVVFGAIKLFGGKGEPEPDETPVERAEPFTATIHVQGPEEVNLAVDGEPLQQESPGVFVLSDTVFTERTITASAPGYETTSWTTSFAEGETGSDTLVLDSLGTSIVQVSFQYQMPEGEEDPGPDAVEYMVDGELIEGSADSIPTGEHVFQAMLEGYRTMPESVLVASPQDFTQTLNVLASEQSQVTLALAADTPGNGIFYIDGERVATGRRMSQVLPFGTYYLQVQMEDREGFAVTINLDEEGYSRTVTLEEIEETGQLMVGPEPWSDVYVDGDLVGTTPFGGVELEPGTYTVRLSNPDFEDDVKTVEITAGETTSVQYNAVAAAEPDETPEDTVATAEPDEELPISTPFAIQQTAPSVPSQARARGDLEGYVTLEVLVGTDGTVQDVSIVSDPLGLGCGQAAVDAVRNWVFSPAMQGDQPVEVPTTVQVRFDIE
ncbi:MAG: TonB family protein [Candidatus Aegiribacteria sp.]|nr:TonB family protein [Candidatus Aegiribacteria sp.]MBD3294681.1 TonB family protein [Candidatus Fermentibacteria bacterium]